MSSRQRERLATESAKERGHDLSACQHERLATKSTEDREARLRDLSARQRERLSIESPKQTAANLRPLSCSNYQLSSSLSVYEREPGLKDSSALAVCVSVR